MSIIIGDKIEPEYKSSFAIEISYEHLADGKQLLIIKDDPLTGDADTIERLVHVLTAYQEIDNKTLTDIDAIVAILTKAAEEISTTEREVERLISVFYNIIPNNVFIRGAWAKVSKFQLYWYNDKGEKHIAILSD